MTTFSIPTEYQKLSVKKAALLSGVPRTSFIRKYLESGRITLLKEADGTDYITYDELYRIFGETATQNLKAYMSGQLVGQGVQPDFGKNEHIVAHDQKHETSLLDIEKTHKLELELARIQGERDRLSALLDEKSRLVDEKQSLILDQKEQIRRYFEELQITRRLLEDKAFKQGETFRESELQASQQAKIETFEHSLALLSERLEIQTPEKPKGFWEKLKFIFG
jgi:hypothetical protein